MCVQFQSFIPPYRTCWCWRTRERSSIGSAPLQHNCFTFDAGSALLQKLAGGACTVGNGPWVGSVKVVQVITRPSQTRHFCKSESPLTYPEVTNGGFSEWEVLV